MSVTSYSSSSISEIRAHLATAIKSWSQQTSDLTWPEGDSSLAVMDGHMSVLRITNARLAVIESLAPAVQHSLAARFDEASVQDPGKFAPFVAAVEQAAP